MKKIWPAAERNQQPLFETLKSVLPSKAFILEIASGTGQHAHAFSRKMPDWTWQATDLDEENLASIRAWQSEGPDNMLPPLPLDVQRAWPVKTADAIVCANMIHIAPREAMLALFAGAGTILHEGAVLVTYGPYMVGGAHTSESNAKFDKSLRSRNPSWGLRDVDDLRKMAKKNGLFLESRIAMPANNFTLVFRALA